MDNTIDTLQLEIESSTTDAQRGLTKLKNSLQKLTEMSNAVANMNSDGISKLKEMAQGVESLANAGSNPGLSAAVSELRKLAKIDFSNLGAGSEKISEIADKVGEITNANPTSTITPPETADEYVFIAPSVDIEESKGKLSQLKAFAVNIFSSIKTRASSIFSTVGQVIRCAFEDVIPVFQKLGNAAKNARIVPNVNIEEAKSKLSQLKAFAISVFSAIKMKASSIFGGVAQVIGGAFRGVVTVFQKLGTVSRGVAQVISGAFKGIVSVFQKLGSAANSVFGAIKKVRSCVGKLKSATSGATKKFNGFVTAIGRVAFYRAIRFVLSQITTAFKEGTNNVYQYSKAIGGNLASSMDKIASSFLYFKNSIGAMVSPIINALAPAIEYMIDKVVDFVNVLNQLFAKLSGASTWTKALKVPVEYAEATKEAEEATKSFTAGFDQLNVISDNGSSNSSSGMDYSSMFKEMQLDSDFATWIDRIKDAIENGDWAGVGKILGDKVNEVIDKVDFAGIGDKLGSGMQSAFEVLYHFLDAIDFDKIGAGIATTLNHMMEKIDFGLVGKTFAKKWTILVDTLYGFVTTFDWTKFGLAIADFINGWFEEVDLTKSFQTIQELILGLFESFSQAIRNVEWYKIGTQIMDAIESIDWKSLLGKLGTLFSDAVVGLLDLILGVVGETDWGKIAQDICAGIGNMLANIEWSEIIARIEALIVELVVQLPGLIVGALGGIADLLGGLFEGFGLDSIAGFFYGIGEAMRSVGTWLKENLVDPVVIWVKDLFGIHSPSTVFAEIGVSLIEGLLQGIANTWHVIIEFFSETLENIKQIFGDAWDVIKNTAFTAWDGIKNFISDTWTNIATTSSTVLDNMMTTISTTWENIKTNSLTVWGDIETSFSSTWENVKTTANTTLSGLKSTITATWSNIKTDTSTKWNNIKSSLSAELNSMKSTASTVFDNIKTTSSTAWSNIKSNSTAVLSNLKSTMSNAWGDIKSTAVSAFSSIESHISATWDNLKSYSSGTLSSITSFVSDMKSEVTSGVDTVHGLFDSAVSAAQSAVSMISNALSSIGEGLSNAISGVGDIFGFASGGFPEAGQLFIAREAGPEMVGSIGGRTAVANNDQIVEGIYQGVLAAMRAAGNGNSGNFDVRVYLDGKQITAAVEKRQRERGATIYPGGVLNGI